MSTPADLLRNSADLIVLSVLAEGPRYGYAISKQVAAQSEGAIRLSAGMLYPLLHELEQQGLLLSSWELVQASDNQDEDKGRKRKWYELTAAGKKRLTAQAAEWSDYAEVIRQILSLSPLRTEGAGN